MELFIELVKEHWVVAIITCVLVAAHGFLSGMRS